MKLSLNWLREYIPLNQAAEEIAKILTSLGLEVDSVTTIGGSFAGVVVAEVLETEKHPDADKLCVAKVFDGKETFQVVCGASNCRPGIKTALARVGATLKDEKGEFKIKKSKLRGVESFGMLCAADELGLMCEEASGIMEFPSHMETGLDLSSYFADTILEISLTPNLWHCNSVIGVARELSGALEIPASLPAITLKEEQGIHSKDLIAIDIEDKEKCPRYAARIVKNVQVKESPDWLKQRLTKSGIRPVNNVVDITNYVFLEMGQPLHAFDLDQLNGRIVVRNALDGEKILTLDDNLRSLTKDDLLICDAMEPIAIAGIMGGKNSEVTENTKSILIESAYFCPKSVRKTSKTLKLSTDASKRFERGADPNSVLWALDRVCMLIEEICRGSCVAQVAIDKKFKEFKRKTIECRLNRVNSLLGTNLSISEVENVFKRLDFVYSFDGVGAFKVTVPTYRGDLAQEIDLVEEIARVYGYDNIEPKLPYYTSSNIPHTPIFLFERTLREKLLTAGLQEFLTCDLIGPSILNILGDDLSSLTQIKVMNPISVEQSVLRTSLLPGLLNAVKYNNDHQNRNIAGFEVGRIHYKKDDIYEEQSVVGIILSGEESSQNWYSKPRMYDFYDLKGIIENFLKELRIDNFRFCEDSYKIFHTGRQAAVYVGDVKIGSFGEVHPLVAKKLDVDQRIYFAEFNLKDLMQVVQIDYVISPLPLYPVSERDWTITVDENLAVQDLINLVKQTLSNLLKSVTLLDIYRSEKLGPGLKNVTLHFVYQDDNKTLSQEEVDNEQLRIMQETIKNINEKSSGE